MEKKEFKLYTGVKAVEDTIPQCIMIELDLNQFNIEDNKIAFQISKQDFETLIKYFEL